MRLAVSIREDRFVAIAGGIRREGVEIEARRPIEWNAYDPLTGGVAAASSLTSAERSRLPIGPGALVFVGRVWSE